MSWFDSIGSVTYTGAGYRSLANLQAKLRRLAACWSPIPIDGGPLVGPDVAIRTGYLDTHPDQALTVEAATQDRGRALMAPAACHIVYAVLSNRSLGNSPTHFAISTTCCRVEHDYTPMRRQQVFRMQEVVAFGDEARMEAFRDESLTQIEDVLLSLGVEVVWKPATDSFFASTLDRRTYLARKLAAGKLEAVTADGLAVASFNAMGHGLTSAFAITGPDGEPVRSACWGIGVDRLLGQLLRANGGNWSLLREMLQEVDDM